jgi:hypothetical protein
MTTKEGKRRLSSTKTGHAQVIVQLRVRRFTTNDVSVIITGRIVKDKGYVGPYDHRVTPEMQHYRRPNGLVILDEFVTYEVPLYEVVSSGLSETIACCASTARSGKRLFIRTTNSEKPASGHLRPSEPFSPRWTPGLRWIESRVRQRRTEKDRQQDGRSTLS